MAISKGVRVTLATVAAAGALVGVAESGTGRSTRSAAHANPGVPLPQAERAAHAAYKAGFRGRALVEVVALAGAASNYQLAMAARSDSGRLKLGILALDTSKVTSSCSKTINCSFASAFRISGKGKNLSVFPLYGSRRFKNQIPLAKIAAARVLG